MMGGEDLDTQPKVMIVDTEHAYAALTQVFVLFHSPSHHVAPLSAASSPRNF